MAETAVIYSESGVGKTTICCSLAKMVYEETGLLTRLISVEGWEPIANEGLIYDPKLNPSGIVHPFNLLSRPSNKILSTMRKLQKGWWPKIVDKEIPLLDANGVETGQTQTRKVREIVEDKAEFNKVGLYFIETLDNLSNKFMSILIQEEVVTIDDKGRTKIQSIGPQGSSGRYEEDGEVFGGNSEGHYNIAQTEVYNIVTAYSGLQNSLGNLMVVWTSHVGTGKIKKPMYGMQIGESCFCPAIVGEAKNALVPSWMGDCFHLESLPEVWDANGNKLQEKQVKAYYQNHRDIGMMEGPQYICKSRVGPSSVDELESKWPGGFIPLGTKEGEGLDQYYRWLKSRKGGNVKKMKEWKEKVDAGRVK